MLGKGLSSLSPRHLTAFIILVYLFSLHGMNANLLPEILNIIAFQEMELYQRQAGCESVHVQYTRLHIALVYSQFADSFKFNTLHIVFGLKLHVFCLIIDKANHALLVF